MRRSTSRNKLESSDDSSDDDLGENLDTNWLDDVDPEQEALAELERAMMATQRRPSYQIQMVREKGDYRYSADQANLILALNEVDGLGFAALADELQHQLVESTVVRTYEPGELIMAEDTLPEAMPLFLVVASASTATTAEVDLMRKGKVVTRLKRGDLFGQRFFLTRQVPTPNTPETSKSVPSLIFLCFHASGGRDTTP
jgi:CRP-like cAMP-binding protein